MENKKLLLLLFFTIAMGLMLGACSKNSFSGREGSAFQQCVDVRPEVKCSISCESGVCVETYDYTIQTAAQVKDILFVVDTSGSMSEEQAKMGSMFPNFLKNLSDVNYRIGITTTDVRDAYDLEQNTNPPNENNGNGAYQDGSLIAFPNGNPFLDGSLSLATEQSYFEQTIKRQETLDCENNKYKEEFCPSGDERGILAAAMTIDKNPSSFIRPVGHLAVIVLSDEDEGSNGVLAETDVEEPANFIEFFKTTYPNKSLTFHSIIVQPKELLSEDEIDTNGQSLCYNAQYRAGHPPGQYGSTYAALTSLTERSVLGDICASDGNYADQLKAIGESVSEVREVLPCTPIDGDVQVDLVPKPSYTVEIQKNLSQNEILFSAPLPKGTEVRFRFKCLESEA